MTEQVGTNADDTINGEQFENLIVGRGGSDQITGGKGADVIYGDNNSAGVAGVSKFGYEVFADRVATITFQGESAGYKNSFGMYKIDANGNFTSVEVLFANASEKNSGGNLIKGQSQVQVNLKAGEMIGFFVAPDAYSKSAGILDRTDGHFEFRDSSGKPGRIGHGSDLSLWFVPKDGSAALQVKTQYGTSMFFTKDALNIDNISHVRTVGSEVTGVVQIGFEDLLNGGDKDFDDSRFSIDVGVDNIEGFPSTRVVSSVPTDDKIWAGEGNDKVYGGSGKDQIWGGAGDDLLEGGSGDDQIWGEAGNDTINGGSYNDRMWGGAGNDKINGGGGNDDLYGEAGNDTLDGGMGNDRIWDGDGDDKVSGGSGMDYVYVGKGNDSYVGGDGFDTIDFSGTGKAVTVNLAKRVAEGALGNDKLVGFERVIGTSASDTITGDRFDNTLEGRNGNDVIRGMGGNDTLIGGSGGDRFVWGTRSDLIDVRTGTKFVDKITDFDTSVDKLDFRDLMAKVKGADASRFMADDQDAGTLIKVNLGKLGWLDVVMLEGVHVGDMEKVDTNWLLV
jgi:serralysin